MNNAPSVANEGAAAGDAPADPAADGAALAALLADAAGDAPPPPLHAARNAALADNEPAFRKPRRLTRPRDASRMIRSNSWSATIDLLLPVDPGPVDLTLRG
jgi:hypothetical protein